MFQLLKCNEGWIIRNPRDLDNYLSGKKIWIDNFDITMLLCSPNMFMLEQSFPHSLGAYKSLKAVLFFSVISVDSELHGIPYSGDISSLSRVYSLVSGDTGYI